MDYIKFSKTNSIQACLIQTQSPDFHRINPREKHSETPLNFHGKCTHRRHILSASN